MRMKNVKMCSKPLLTVLVQYLVVLSLSRANPVPETTTTSRSATNYGETIKQLANQLININTTSSDIITLDTRTPPRVKQQTKFMNKNHEKFENSHAGIAIPMDEDDIQLEETTKKLNFYKVEKPTTNSGLSTWILLSGQSESTPKPTTKKPVVKPNEHRNASTSVVVEPQKIKPIFKKRITTTTTRKPIVTTTRISTTTVKQNHPSTTKMTKIKASVLNSAVNNKKTTPQIITTTTTTKRVFTTTTSKPKTTLNKGSSSTTTLPILDNRNMTLISNSSSSLSVEAKDTETELKDSTKRPTKSSNKRKKNKNRRRRPSDKSDNSTAASTKIDKIKSKEKPIGTQLYNYLSREVMPTVGVGLVGLMVTAGLASYFLYPFGVARRSYEVDRRDREGTYYYDDYSGGMPEEEAIGKVIAGMPANSLYGNNYKTPTSRHSFSSSYNNFRDTPDTFDYQQPITYNKDSTSESGFTTEEPQKFVVGNVPTEEATPVAVPEHGPRNLRIRRRKRQVPEVDDAENEISDTTRVDEFTTTTTTTLKPVSSSVKPSNSTQIDEKFTSFFNVFKELLHLKVNLGLQLIQNATQAVSKYVSHVRRRLDEHYKNYTLHH